MFESCDTKEFTEILGKLLGVAVTSISLAVYLGDWIKGFIKLNLVVLLLLVQVIYVGIRTYVKGYKRARGYY